MIVTCRVCGKRKKQVRPQANLCQECYNASMRDYYRANKEKMQASNRERGRRKRQDPGFVASERKRGREYWADQRHKAMMAYGGYKCACCGETEPKFLSLDHIENDGASHRRELGYDGNGKGASSATLSWMRKNNYPSGIQVLCMNCNFGKARNGGICPHQEGVTTVPKGSAAKRPGARAVS